MLSKGSLGLLQEPYISGMGKPERDTPPSTTHQLMRKGLIHKISQRDSRGGSREKQYNGAELSQFIQPCSAGCFGPVSYRGHITLANCCTSHRDGQG